MDFLECKICNVPFDEDDHRPRQAPCGHGLCSVCLKALIKNSIFECPKCRKKNKVDVPEDLSVNYDLIDVIRAFKAKKVQLTKETETTVYGAAHDEVRNIHCRAISHWCSKCQMWICVDCLESHSTLLGCSTTLSNNAMKTLKEKHTKISDTLVTEFEGNARQVSLRRKEHSDKNMELLEMAAKHDEEEKKLGNSLEQANIQKDKLVESTKLLNEADSPNSVSDYIKIVTQRIQILRSWCVKNNHATDTPLNLNKALEEKNDIYVQCVIKDEERHSKLSLNEERIYFHKFLAQAVEDGCIIFPFARLEKLIPSRASLVFLEMSLGGVVKGFVLLRLNNDTPNIRKNILTIVTGQEGESLNGIKCDYHHKVHFRAGILPFGEIPVTPDSNARTNANRGDVMGYFANGYLQYIYFQVAAYHYGTVHTRLHSAYKVVGSIESGMDIIQECYDKHSSGVVISDCGLVIENE